MHTAIAALPAGFAHRSRSVELTVRTPDGRPLAGVEVGVAQASHAFGFGNIGFDFIELANGESTGGPRPFGGASVDQAEHLAELWLAVFSSATLPFYWRGFEPVRGRPDTDRLRRTAQWFVDRGVRVKGHPLVWHTLAPEWLADLPEDQVEAEVRARITRDVAAMAGPVTVWDAINEVVIMPEFTAEPNAITPLARRLGRVGMVRLAFETARAADPTATLLLNDFNLSPAYERLIEQCLEAGIRIDGLGLQSHLHQGWWGADKTLDVLDRFARFGLPLHFSEVTLVSGALMPPQIVDLNDYQVASWPSTPAGEDRQAAELAEYYGLLLAHPAVASITYWGLSDDGAWLGAPAGLVRADGTPKPAYDALRELVTRDCWLAPTTAVTDADGRVTIGGMPGRYTVEVAGTTTTVEVTDAGTETVTVR